MAIPGDMLDFLTKKYAILQQQAVADTARAGAAVTSANAAANLDNTRAGILPTESAAAIALQRAQAGLTTAQTGIVAPESAARIGLMGTEASLNRANTGLVSENTVTAKRGNRLISILPDSLRSVMGSTPLSGLGGGFKSGDPLPPKRVGETQASYLDRINGL
jgi:hypothetical protein